MFTGCNGASRWEYSNQGTTNYVSVTVIDVHDTQLTCRICAVSFTPNSLGTFIYCSVIMKLKLCCEIQCKWRNRGNFEGLNWVNLSHRPWRRREGSIKIPVNEITCPSVTWRRIGQGWILVRAMVYFAVWQPTVFGTLLQCYRNSFCHFYAKFILLYALHSQ